MQKASKIMSVIVALVDEGRTYIGSDRLAITQSGQCWDVGEKWYEGEDDWWFGALGDTRVTDIIRANIRTLTLAPLGAEPFGPDVFVRRLLHFFEDAGRMRPQFPDNTTAPVWFDGGILACPGNAWEVDCQLGITPVLPYSLAARGSGAQVAIGAAWGVEFGRRGLSEEQMAPFALVSAAIQAAEAHNVNVRGLWVRTVVHHVERTFLAVPGGGI
jgi:hypothetical protein